MHCYYKPYYLYWDCGYYCRCREKRCPYCGGVQKPAEKQVVVVREVQVPAKRWR